MSDLALPLTFTPSEFGREIVRLGNIMIGEVASNPCGTRVQAWARIYLPEVTPRPLPASSLAMAREIVRNKTRDWVEAAGLLR